MSDLWIFMFIIWAVVELIGFIRKKELRIRMKSGAIWSVILVSITTVGMMSPEQNAILQLGLSLCLYGIIAAIIYFIRLSISKVWKSRKERTSNTSN